VPVIGFLSGASPGRFESRVGAFREGLAETGVIDGQRASPRHAARNLQFEDKSRLLASRGYA
jgi:putative ABC transport system substrate-binding protein